MSEIYTSIQDYVNAVTKAMPEAMNKYVGPAVRQILKAYIANDIYGAYNPVPGGWVNGTTYNRRHELYNGVDSWIDGDELIATSVAVPSESILGKSVYGGSDGGFLTLLASANTGISGCTFPRPVIPQAQAAVDKNIDMLKDLLVNGLEKML